MAEDNVKTKAVLPMADGTKAIVRYTKVTLPGGKVQYQPSLPQTAADLTALITELQADLASLA